MLIFPGPPCLWSANLMYLNRIHQSKVMCVMVDILLKGTREAVGFQLAIESSEVHMEDKGYLPRPVEATLWRCLGAQILENKCVVWLIPQVSDSLDAP